MKGNEFTLIYKQYCPECKLKLKKDSEDMIFILYICMKCKRKYAIYKKRNKIQRKN